MTVSETATAISVVVAALSFVYGVSAWRREFVGKRRIELAEEVLALAYEIEEIIGSIRRRSIYVPQSNDSGDKDQARSLADSIMERICSSQERFATFHSYKYRFEAMFGDDIHLSFCEIRCVRNEIAYSVEMLAKDYWPPNREHGMDSVELEWHRKGKFQLECIIWNRGKDNDKIGPRVREAVSRFEDVVRKESIKQRSLLERLFSLGKV